MSNKFTGITSAGSAIPVYDKDAHSALEQKLDTSAFSSVSGDFLTEVPESAVSGFATHEEVESATSGKADWSGVIEYRNKPSGNAIFADGNTLTNVGQIVGSGNFYIVPSAVLQVPKVITVTTDGLTAAGLTSNSGYGLTANGLTAYDHSAYGGFSANGLSAGKKGPLWIQGETEVFSAGGAGGFTFSSVNTGIGTAKLTVASPNSSVQTYSPKFEARISAGAGFSIEGSGARGYDHNGNVIWDTSNPPAPNNLVGYADTKASTGDLNGNIVLTVVPKSNQGSLSSSPYTVINGDGLKLSYGAGAPSASMSPAQIGFDYQSAHTTVGYSDVKVSTYTAYNDPNKIEWSLTGSVQKREIECDSATSAITAIAGSAIGGKEYSAGANIDITDEVISGKDWSEDIASATSGLMQTSGLEYDGDKISGYMGSAFAGGGEVPEGVMVESAVEYNAVNEISGYNGSAIAQYGAEKQWLVHDDTLVHAANSAQYALGCNISAIAQLLGKIDETVLWSGTWSASNDAPTSITLSESPMNFERIKIIYGTSGNSSGNNISLGSYEYMPIGNAVAIHSFFIGNTATKATYTVHTLWSGTSGTNWTRKYYAFKSLTGSAWNTEGTWQPIRQVIGIGRKS